MRLTKSAFRIKQQVTVALTGAEGTVVDCRFDKQRKVWAYCLKGEGINPKAWYAQSLLHESPVRKACGITNGKPWVVMVWQHPYSLACYAFSLSVDDKAYGGGISGSHPYLHGCFESAAQALAGGVAQKEEICQ